MKSCIQKLIAGLARAIIRKYHPIVIGITGSVGKTSAKEAINLVLKDQIRIRSSEKNYNNEFGVPLTIIGVQETPGRSLFGWCNVLIRAFHKLSIFDYSYPRIIVLEMGADRTGDIDTLTAIAPCTIGVITAIGPAHLEKFGTMEALVNEKKCMVRNLTSGSTAIINADDPFLYPINGDSNVRIISFGFSVHADVRVTSFVEHYVFESSGDSQMSIFFECIYNNQTVGIELKNVVGKQSVYAILAGLAVASALDIPLAQSIEDIRAYRGPKGRMRILQGMKKTLIIDDTYNSSPLAVSEGLAVLEKIRIDERARRIAILGDMLELGIYTEELHRKIGAECSAKNIDFIVTVGAAAKWIADEAAKTGIDKSHIFSFDTTDEVGESLRTIMKQGDAILVKGSQGIRLERVVKEIMAEPEQAQELLVRQGKEWK